MSSQPSCTHSACRACFSCFLRFADTFVYSTTPDAGVVVAATAASNGAAQIAANTCTSPKRKKLRHNEERAQLSAFQSRQNKPGTHLQHTKQQTALICTLGTNLSPVLHHAAVGRNLPTFVHQPPTTPFATDSVDGTQQVTSIHIAVQPTVLHTNQLCGSFALKMSQTNSQARRHLLMMLPQPHTTSHDKEERSQVSGAYTYLSRLWGQSQSLPAAQLEAPPSLLGRGPAPSEGSLRRRTAAGTQARASLHQRTSTSSPHR